MLAERSEFQKIKEIREELQALKDRINLIEAELDIRVWKQVQSQSVFSKEANDQKPNLPMITDDSILIGDNE